MLYAGDVYRLPRPPRRQVLKARPPAESPDPEDLGPGFAAFPQQSPTVAERVHEFLVREPSGLYERGVSRFLQGFLGVAQNKTGVDPSGLMLAQRALYQTLAPSLVSGGPVAPAIFRALAQGQGAYVYLGPDRVQESEQLMRLFAGVPGQLLEPVVPPLDDMDRVRNLLLEKVNQETLPTFIDLDGKLDSQNSTESILSQSVASIVHRENYLASDFSDPRSYYQWLVTRVQSQSNRLAPWLLGVNRPLYDQIGRIQRHLVPDWLKGQRKGDPLGAASTARGVQQAYQEVMDVVGKGQAPTWAHLTNFADVAVSLDRSLLSGVQTFWVKLLSQISSEQRQSLLAPLARAWVRLNLLPPDHPQFQRVSPDKAPRLEVWDGPSRQVVTQRYDRSLALGQVVDHSLAGLGLAERREFVDLLLKEILHNQGALAAREGRLRQHLGKAYQGLPVDTILHQEFDHPTPDVKEALDELAQAASSAPESTELNRHYDMLAWVANRLARYGDGGLRALLPLQTADEFARHPLIVSEFYQPPILSAGRVTPLPEGPGQVERLGMPVPDRKPVKMSLVLEGGGGRGFAFPEVLQQIRQGLSQAEGEVAIDEFIGSSAGALTAGLLAAGYSGDQLSRVLQKLDFRDFFSDYLWLSGGIDPKVRGINRSGLFSTQKMYKTLSELIQEKCPVVGRPVMFRDLPFKLRVTATMLNTDIPDNLRAGLQVQPDGMVVFSSETTPNMDVAAALCCSAAVPGFFNAPQLQVCQNHGQLFRMQMTDGGIVNNFPIAQASQDEQAFLMTLPAYHQAPNPAGGPPLDLTLLNLDPATLGPVDEHNRDSYKTLKPHLMSTIQAAADAGYGRVVMALKISDLAVPRAAILQGANRQQSERLLDLAHQHSLPVLNAQEGARAVAIHLKDQPTGWLQQQLVNLLLDEKDVFTPVGLFHGSPSFTPGSREVESPAELFASVKAATMTAPSQLDKRLFEKT